MGRFKRHQRKNRDTTTRVANPPLRFSSRVNINKRPPEISDRVRELLSRESEERVKTRGERVSKLFGEVMLSAKRRGKYASIITNFQPINRFIGDDTILPTMAMATVYPDNIHLGTNLQYIGSIRTIGDGLNLYDSLIGRLYLLVCAFRGNYYGYFVPPTTPVINKYELLKDYATDYLKKKKNLKVYPNEVMLTFLFGTIAASVTMIIFTTLMVLWFDAFNAGVFLFFWIASILIYIRKTWY
jgi:hypothetical protein